MRCCRLSFSSVFSVFLMLGLLLSCPLSAAPANLLANPGFEILDGAEPAFWARRNYNDDKRELSVDGAIHRGGKRSLLIHNREETLSRWRTGHLRDFSLQAGSRCLLTAWVKTEKVSEKAYLWGYFMDAGGGILSQPLSGGVAGTQDWQQVKIDCQVPEGTAYMMIYLSLRGKGKAWFDDLVLEGTPVSPSPRKGLPAWNCNAEDFIRLEGFFLEEWNRKNVLKLKSGRQKGEAEAVFWGESARYDIKVLCRGPSDRCDSWTLRINDREVARWTPGEMKQTKETSGRFYGWKIADVDIQSRSRIFVEARSKKGNCGVVARLEFVPKGRFGGTFLGEEALRLPPSLRIYESNSLQDAARRMLTQHVNAFGTRLMQQREEMLKTLKTPQQWQAHQKKTRDRLVEFFGDFGPKCPLNPVVTGRVDRPDYTIEKIIIESQPGYYCTTNFYLPKRRQPPYSGILFTCGHAADGKAYHLYHEACLGFVLKGYAVLALDPTGQGERSEYSDPETGKARVPLCVPQHYYLARPSWLVGRSLSGYRTWDCIRAVDYLISRPEVNREKLAVVGNSGGGQMALLAAAADPRLAVCVAAHPGGNMENSYLSGQTLIDRDILGLIPPRPCAFVVGETSGEVGGHSVKLKDMQLYYQGLGVGKERGEMFIVDGVHNMEKPKREASYAWVNKWLGHENEGGDEPPLKPESVETLNCTPNGSTMRDLKSESGQTLNAKVAARLRPSRELAKGRKAQNAQLAEIKAKISRRIGLRIPASRPVPQCSAEGAFDSPEFSAEKLLITSEPGISLPTLLLTPKNTRSSGPLLVCASDLGKPKNSAKASLPLQLVRRGHTVVAVDVRGTGETDPRIRASLKPLELYQLQQASYESTAMRAAYARTTILAMRTLDIVRTLDYLETRSDLANRKVVLVGEGLGGLWMLAATLADRRPDAVVCVGTIPSYKLIVGSQYYRSRDYFWVNGALKDFDVPDLMALAAPRPLLLLNPMDAMLAPLDFKRVAGICEWPRKVYAARDAVGKFQTVKTETSSPDESAAEIETFLKSLRD